MRNPFQAMIENQVASIQAQLASAMEELARTEVEGSSGGGAVRVQMTGAGEVRRVSINPDIMQEQDSELLEDLVCAALRDALGHVSQVKRKKIFSATPLGGLGVDLPDIF